MALPEDLRETPGQLRAYDVFASIVPNPVSACRPGGHPCRPRARGLYIPTLYTDDQHYYALRAQGRRLPPGRLR